MQWLLIFPHPFLLLLLPSSFSHFIPHKPFPFSRLLLLLLPLRLPQKNGGCIDTKNSLSLSLPSLVWFMFEVNWHVCLSVCLCVHVRVSVCMPVCLFVAQLKTSAGGKGKDEQEC